MSSSEGVRVVIHPPDTEPYPHTEGFDVPPGYSATFGVKVCLQYSTLGLYVCMREFHWLIVTSVAMAELTAHQ